MNGAQAEGWRMLSVAIEGEIVTVDERGTCRIRGVDVALIRDLRLSRAALRRVQQGLRTWVEGPASGDTPRARALRSELDKLELERMIGALSFVDDWPSVDRLDRLEGYARKRWESAQKPPQ